VAEQDRQPIFLRESVEFFVEDRPEVTPGEIVHRASGESVEVHWLGGRTAGSPFERVAGQANGDTVQPGGQRRGLPNRARSPSQHQERGLEHVFGVLVVPKTGPTNIVDEPAVSPHQLGEGSVITAFLEPP
jgi:hypothetical protein